MRGHVKAIHREVRHLKREKNKCQSKSARQNYIIAQGLQKLFCQDVNNQRDWQYLQRQQIDKSRISITKLSSSISTEVSSDDTPIVK